MSKKLYVGNLLYEVDDAALKDLFSQFGNVLSAQVIKYRDSGRSKGFGFVEFEADEEAQKAIDTLNGQDNQGRRLVVSEARPMQPREPGDRGGGGQDRPREENRIDSDPREDTRGVQDPNNDLGVDPVQEEEAIK